ncbi:hypothetical protein OUZ56_009625 [Daphnia magna]|uniref:Uncharacterized protein n=1 Tax=Daphnia magna TaxID=35525 RepID=A0ABR0AGI0_9CRUS|nr:hypothetical protein OUZ56_009625 [Daphnia magna]
MPVLKFLFGVNPSVGQYPFPQRRYGLSLLRAGAGDKQYPLSLGRAGKSSSERLVFRRLGFRESFPRETSAPAKPKISPPAMFAPYARPADQDLKFLNDKERAELEAVQKVKEEGGDRNRSIRTADLSSSPGEGSLDPKGGGVGQIVRRPETSGQDIGALHPLADRWAGSPSDSCASRGRASTRSIHFGSRSRHPARSSKSSKSSKSRSSSKHSRKETPGETPRSSKES